MRVPNASDRTQRWSAPYSEDDDGDTLEVMTAGDVAPWVMVPQWLLLAASGNAVKLYAILLAHVNQTRGDQAAYPLVTDLCRWLGFSEKQPRSVKRYRDELVELGALAVVQRYDARGMRTRNKYILRHNPPDGFVGDRSFPEHYRRRNETAGQPVVRSSALRSDRGKQDNDSVSAGGSVVRSSAPRSALQRTSVVRSSAPQLEELKTTRRTTSSSSFPSSEPRRKRDGERVQEEEGRRTATTSNGQSPPEALALVDRAAACWGRPPTDEERARIARKVTEALAEGATPAGVMHGLTRDLETARNPIAVITTRTRNPGWADHDPAAQAAEAAKPKLPPHCGDTRCRGGWLEDDDPDAPPRRCSSWPHQITAT